MDVEGLPEGSQRCAWAAVGHASRAVLGPWQGPLAAALLPAMIYNLSLNGNSPGCSPNSLVLAGNRLTQPAHAPGSNPCQLSLSCLLGWVFMMAKTQKLLCWRKVGLRVAPRRRRPHGTLETDATLLVTLGELDTEELGSVKTRFVHNSNRKQQQ